MANLINNLDKRVSKAVAHYWLKREAQKDKQKKKHNAQKAKNDKQ